METSGQHPALEAESPAKDPVSHLTGGWVGTRTGLDAVYRMKISCPAGIRTPDHPTRNLLHIPIPHEIQAPS